MNIYKVNDNIEAWSYEHHEFQVSDIFVVKENCVMESLGLFDYVNNTKKHKQILRLSSIILIGA